MPQPTPPPDPVEAAIRQMRAAGERVTIARTEVLRVLADAGHLSADEVFATVARTAPGVHRTTIYRALDALERLGLVTGTRTHRAASTYRLAAHLAGNTHLYVSCHVCGTVVPVAADLLSGVAARLTAEAGFTLDPTAVALTGRCRACATPEGGGRNR